MRIGDVPRRGIAAMVVLGVALPSAGALALEQLLPDGAWSSPRVHAIAEATGAFIAAALAAVMRVTGSACRMRTGV